MILTIHNKNQIIPLTSAASLYPLGTPAYHRGIDWEFIVNNG